MDITCATCKEPWDNHHMREDAIWEVWDGCEESESYKLCKAFLADAGRSLTPPVRSALKEDGWMLGGTIYCILECPCCKPNEAHNGALDKEKVEDRKAAYLVLEEGLAGDDDGFIATLNDFEHAGLLGD